jgi:phosphohistidine phosphatase SixA
VNSELRRRFVLGAAVVPIVGVAQGAEPVEVPWAQATKQWRSGGWILIMRHEQTVPGTGDPPGFRLDECSTQRNLSDVGRERARLLGARLREASIKLTDVRSSQWCRCLDTARGIVGDAFQPWPALNSFFDDRSTEPAQTQALQQAFKKLGPNDLWLWVTHQVNITALTGIVPRMGEGLAMRVVNNQPVVKFRWMV